jgi:hypothetical protein
LPEEAGKVNFGHQVMISPLGRTHEGAQVEIEQEEGAAPVLTYVDVGKSSKFTVNPVSGEVVVVQDDLAYSVPEVEDLK